MDWNPNCNESGSPASRSFWAREMTSLL